MTETPQNHPSNDVDIDLTKMSEDDTFETASPEQIAQVDHGLQVLGIADTIPKGFHDYLNYKVKALDYDRKMHYPHLFYGFVIESLGNNTGFLPTAFPYALNDKSRDKDTYLKVARVHFEPTIENDEGSKIVFTPTDAKTLSEKKAVRENAMIGALSYLSLVEAGLIEKPEVIIGSTNSSMADFAELFGISRPQTWAKRHLAGDVDPHIDEDDFQTYLDMIEMDPKADMEFGTYNQMVEDPSRLFEAMIFTELEKRATDKVSKGVLHLYADNILKHFGAEGSENFVYGSYEDFKQRVLRFYHRRGIDLLNQHFERTLEPKKEVMAEATALSEAI